MGLELEPSRTASGLTLFRQPLFMNAKVLPLSKKKKDQRFKTFADVTTKSRLSLKLFKTLRVGLVGVYKGRFTRYDFVACDNGLRQAHDMIYDCCVRQLKCRSILKHVLKRCDNRKSCRRPVVSLSHATKSYRVNRP